MGFFCYLLLPIPLAPTTKEVNMKKKEIIEKIRRRLAKCEGQRKAVAGIAQLIRNMDEALALLGPIVVHGKEATDEYNEYPCDANKVVMELARQNVLHASYGMATVLEREYEGLTKLAKEVFTHREFCELITERLTTLLYNNQ